MRHWAKERSTEKKRKRGDRFASSQPARAMRRSILALALLATYAVRASECADSEDDFAGRDSEAHGSRVDEHLHDNEPEQQHAPSSEHGSKSKTRKRKCAPWPCSDAMRRSILQYRSAFDADHRALLASSGSGVA